MTVEDTKKICSACGHSLDAHNEGVELWGSWFCSKCFFGRAKPIGRELSPEEAEVLRSVGRELAGFLPPELVEMILLGFHKRVFGSPVPPAPELARAVGEIQRLTAFACFRQILNLLKTWQDSFSGFVGDQEAEIRERIRRLTDLDGPV